MSEENGRARLGMASYARMLALSEPTLAGRTRRCYGIHLGSARRLNWAVSEYPRQLGVR
jgi:hypothetical protein